MLRFIINLVSICFTIDLHSTLICYSLQFHLLPLLLDMFVKISQIVISLIFVNDPTPYRTFSQFLKCVFYHCYHQELTSQVSAETDPVSLLPKVVSLLYIQVT